LLITAACGGSNGPRTRIWRWTAQRFASETGMKIERCHDSPGTSKWNKIEHRLFCHITRNWQGVPPESHEVVVNLIVSTKTTTGFEVHAWLDESEYEKSRKTNDDQLDEVIIERDDRHGEWNDQIIPSTR
jgi:Rhodopirellula transposase DDE domain